MSNSQQKLVSNVKNNSECVLNILAWEEPKYDLWAMGSCKSMLQLFLLFVLGSPRYDIVMTTQEYF